MTNRTDEIGHLSWDADWVQRNTKLTLNPEQVRCVDVLCTIARPYNLQLINDGWRGILTSEQVHARELDDEDEPPFLAPVEIGPHWLILGFRGDLGTFDGAEMTRLVLAAHEHAVRASVSPAVYRYEDDEGNSGPDACLRLMLHAREREGTACWDWHPTIEQAMARVSGSPQEASDG